MTSDSNWEHWERWGPYYVSDDALVMNHRGKILRPFFDAKLGYENHGLSVNGTAFTVRAHRLVAELFVPNPLGLPCVDHIDGNRRNNDASNLRWASHAQNSYNSSARGGSSAFKGVFAGYGGKFIAAIVAGGRKVYLGTHDTELAAARAYNAAARELHGEFAWLNDV